MAVKEKKQPEKRDDSSSSEISHRLKTRPFLFIGTVVILVIVVVAFVFVPALVPNTQLGGDPVFGYYNKVPVKYVQNNYFSRVLQSVTQSQQLDSNDPYYIIKVGQMWRNAFEETVIQMGILDEMKEAGYIIPEDVVDREVASLPVFQENGRFSPAKYRALDNNTRITQWRQVQDSIAAQYFAADLMSLRTPSKEADFVSSMASPRRNFDLAVFPFSSYPDSEVSAYTAANPELFKITRLSSITVGSGEREARQILDSVKNGSLTFEEAARTNSQDSYAEKGGDMGIRMAWELLPEIGNTEALSSLVNMAKGTLSDLVQVPAGWAFFRAEEAVHVADTTDAAQLEKIRTYMTQNLRGQIEDWLMAEAEKFAAGAREQGFDEAVAGAGITKQTFGPIPVNYGNSMLFTTLSSSGIAALSSAGSNRLFWETAFSTPPGTPSEPLVIGDNVLVLFPLEETQADENDTGPIKNYYPYWVSDGMNQTYRSYFLNNEKLDDRFDEVFWRLWGTGQ